MSDSDFGLIFDISDLGYNPTGEHRDNLISSTISAIFNQGIGVTKAAKIYRNAGYHFADSHFRELYNALIFEYKAKTAIQLLPHDEIIPESKLGTSKYKLTDNYRFVARITVLNKDTNIPEQRYFSMDTSTLGTPEEIENRMLDYYVEHYGNLPEKTLSIELIEAQSNNGA